jgi:hypothetical protein
VGNDVIELAEVGRDLEQVHMQQAHIGEAHRRQRRLPIRDLARRIVNADEGAARQALGHWQQVAAPRAADFEHAAVVDRRGRQAQQGRQSRQGIWVRLNVG